MNEKEKAMQQVIGLMILARQIVKDNKIYLATAYLGDGDILIEEELFMGLFKDYKIEPYTEWYNQMQTEVDGLTVRALTKKGMKNDDF